MPGELHGREPERVEVVFRGGIFRVEVQRWPEGVSRDVVRHPGACAAVVLTGEDGAVLVSQFREAVGRELLEVPAGIYDVPGEAPQQAMRREILEETGYSPTRMEAIGSIFTTPGFTDERIDLFVAWAEPAGTSAEAEVRPVLMPFADAVAAARTGKIQDAKSVVALLRAADRVG